MFYVKLKYGNSNPKIKVYGVDTFDYKPIFLVFLSNSWRWINGDEYEPCEDDND